MRVPITLSYRRDYDLIALYDKLGRKQFSLLMKDALRAMVKQNTNPKVSLSNINLLDVDYSKYRQDIKIILSVMSENDKNLDLLLSHVGRRLKNQFVKQAIRLYVGTSTLTAYLEDDFKEYILKNAVPTQVLIIGNLTESKPRKTKPSIKRVKHTKITPIISTPTPMYIPEQTTPTYKETFDDIQYNNAEIPPTEVAQSEADEMLAMLSAMLDD